MKYIAHEGCCIYRVLNEIFDNMFSSYHLYPIRIKSESGSPSQTEVSKRLIKAGINVNHHYIPVYRHPYFESLGFKAEYCPAAEKYFRETISLPIFPSLSKEEQEKVTENVGTLLP